MITTLTMTYDAWIALGWVVLGLFFTFKLFKTVKVAESNPELEGGAGALAFLLSLGVLFCAAKAWLGAGEVLFK